MFVIYHAFIQFMLIFRYARNGTLEIEGLKTIATTCNVAEEGVKGAKGFFEAKAQEVSKPLYCLWGVSSVSQFNLFTCKLLHILMIHI